MNKSRAICRKPWENLLVEVNGDCYFCCFIIRPGGSIGNLRQDGLEKIWMSRKANRIRKAVSREKIPYFYQACPYFGEFKHRKSPAYQLYFRTHKLADMATDFFRGGFTRHRVNRIIKNLFHRAF